MVDFEVILTSSNTFDVDFKGLMLSRGWRLKPATERYAAAVTANPSLRIANEVYQAVKREAVAMFEAR